MGQHDAWNECDSLYSGQELDSDCAHSRRIYGMLRHRYR